MMIEWNVWSADRAAHGITLHYRGKVLARTQERAEKLAQHGFEIDPERIVVRESKRDDWYRPQETR